MPQPKHVKMLLMVSDFMVSDNSLQVVLRILPRSGNTAWLAALVSLAPPAAESIENFRPTISSVLRLSSISNCVSIAILLSNNGDSLYRFMQYIRVLLVIRRGIVQFVFEFLHFSCGICECFCYRIEIRRFVHKLIENFPSQFVL